MTSSRSLANELPCAACIPYGAHIAEHIVKTLDGNYVLGLRIRGIAFESADVETRNAWHEQFNVFLRNIAAPDLALWAHVIRARSQTESAPAFANAFAEQLSSRYYERLSHVKMYSNDLYLTLVLKGATKVGRMFSWLDKLDPALMEEQQIKAIEALNNLLSITREGLGRFAPEVLGTYRKGDVVHSSLLEFLGRLVNGEWQPFPLARAPINEVLATSRPLFGGDVLELRTPVLTSYMGALTVKEYPANTSPGLLNGLLSLPCEFVLSQSFAFLSRPVAIGIFSRQQGRMVSAGRSREVPDRRARYGARRPDIGSIRGR